MENKYSHPFIFIIGPSGSGKDTIMDLIKEKIDIAFSPSFTTREKRPNEEEGTYKFISVEEFKKMIEDDGFIEYDSHFTDYYGTSKDSVLKLLKNNVVMKQVDIDGFKKIKRNPNLEYDPKNHTIKVRLSLVRVYFLGIVMESVEHTKKAILKRDGNTDGARRRIARMKEEYDFVKENVDYCITNYYNKQEECADEFVKLIKQLDKNE